MKIMIIYLIIEPCLLTTQMLFSIDSTQKTIKQLKMVTYYFANQICNQIWMYIALCVHIQVLWFLTCFSNPNPEFPLFIVQYITYVRFGKTENWINNHNHYWIGWRLNLLWLVSLFLGNILWMRFYILKTL